MADMNAGIILAGQPLNVLDAISQGNQAAAQTNALNTQRDMRNLYQAQGAGILAGDPGALNALAGLDPQSAMQIRQQQLGMQAAQQGMQFDAERMQMLREESKLKAAEYAKGISAQQAAAEAKQIEDGLSGAAFFYDKGDRAGYEAFLAQQGIDPATHPFEQFPALAAQYGGALDALKGFSAMSNPKVTAQSTVAKLAADYKAGLIDDATYEAALKKATAQDGMSLSVGQDGSVQLTQGGAVAGSAPPKLTVDAAKNTGFYGRTLESNRILNDLEAQGTDFIQSNLDAVPLGVGNYARSENFQKFDQARRDFVNAILRRESGAVISDREFENANKQYFPVPGDGPEVIAQKRQNRETAIEGLRVGSAEGAAYVDQQKIDQGKKGVPIVIDGFTIEVVK